MHRIKIVDQSQPAKQNASMYSSFHDISRLLPGQRLLIEPDDLALIHRYLVRQRWIYSIAILLLLSGMIFGMTLILRDWSREKRIAQLRTDFVSNVSHELKTPLTSIRMLAETLRMGRVRSKQERMEYLDIIVGESERLSRLINTVLDFSRIDRGVKQYQMQPIDLTATVSSTVHAMEATLKEKGFFWRTDFAQVSMVADADAIEQAVMNLLSNAVKYSTQRKEILLRLQQTAESIILSVQDHGIGIPSENQTRIFQKFYRIPDPQIREQTGAGLGLTVVKHIVDAHLGKIKVESRVGEGSTFSLIFPRNTAVGQVATGAL